MKMEKEQILSYLADWNFWGNGLNTGIFRKSYINDFIGSASSKEAVILTGIRRCGKSTLLLQLIDKLTTDKKNSLIIYLEDPRVEDISSKDLMDIYRVYLNELKPDKDHYVILDEVQNVFGWEKFVRYLSENKNISVFITGSNSKFLSSEFSTVLSGRYIKYDVMPLSFKEFLIFNKVKTRTKLEVIKNNQKIKDLFNKYLDMGGFPKVALIKDKNEKTKLLNSYYDTIIIKDICLRYKIKQAAKVKELAKFYLTNISKIISINRIKDYLGMNLETVQRYSEYLESGYLLRFVSKFDYSLKKQIANPKKIYCIDNGMRNTVAFRFSGDRGRLLENIVFNELIKRKLEVYYYKTQNGLEVDFIVLKKNKIECLLQVCDNLLDFQTRQREIKALIAAMKETKTKNAVILTKDTTDKIEQDGYKINVMPVWKWLF